MVIPTGVFCGKTKKRILNETFRWARSNDHESFAFSRRYLAAVSMAGDWLSGVDPFLAASNSCGKPRFIKVNHFPTLFPMSFEGPKSANPATFYVQWFLSHIHFPLWSLITKSHIMDESPHRCFWGWFRNDVCHSHLFRKGGDCEDLLCLKFVVDLTTDSAHSKVIEGKGWWRLQGSCACVWQRPPAALYHTSHRLHRHFHDICNSVIRPAMEK